MRILFIGDSITDAGRDRRNYHDLGRGYAVRTAKILTEEFPDTDFEFINMGISANRTGQLFDRLYGDAIAFEPDVIVLLIGINDIGRRYKTGEKHIETSDEQLELNYRSILIQLRKHTKAKILMLSPFILDADIRKLFVLTDENGEPMRSDVEKIVPTVKKLADEYADGFIPLKELFDEAMKTQPEPLYYSADGIHPNENGADFIAKLCADKLKTII
ncbi:MAG: hypothetical protein E7577_03890 [Ruminococcaceae bacterium]|nr:hypothetical protein [Oscillospiraceae bacterium]